MISPAARFAAASVLRSSIHCADLERVTGATGATTRARMAFKARDGIAGHFVDDVSAACTSGSLPAQPVIPIIAKNNKIAAGTDALISQFLKLRSC